jgi:cytochrome c biogenesis protein CcmG, thiol:disulfide interchange protein DsbE
MRRLLWVAPVAALLVVGGVSLFRARPSADLGRPAPTFALPTVADPERTISLDDLRGKRVVLNFWASWCDPCREEAPTFARVARANAPDATFLGVNILDGRDAALAYARRYRIPFESVRDARGTIAKRFGVTGAPETFFIDASGRLAGHYIGAFDGDQLQETVRAFLRLPPGETLRLTGRGETRPVP